MMNYQNVKKYPAYKDSGVEWIGEIPVGWKLKKLKHVVNEQLKYGANESGVEYSPELPRYIRITDFSDEGKLNEQKKLSLTWKQGKDYLLEDGDILFARSGATVGKSYQFKKDMSSEKYYAFAGYLIKAVPNKRIVESDYLNYYTNSGCFENWKKTIFNKATIENIGADKYSQLCIILPPLPEQTAIANFLDKKCSKINRAVAQKEKLVALLKERKQIVIQNAVTKGLNPNAKMKDSGVEWIGEIPEGWEIKRLKYLSKVQSGLTLGKQYNPKNYSKYPYLRVANVQNGFFNLGDVASINIPKNEAKKYLLKKNDILVTEGGDIDKLGRGTIWKSEIAPCLHQNHVFAIRTIHQNIKYEYLSYFMLTNKVRKYFIDTATKTTNLASTNRTTLGNLNIILPTLAEQKTIVAHIETQSQKINKAITLQQNQIEKLKEYKSILINNAVTGKIKVC